MVLQQKVPILAPKMPDFRTKSQDYTEFAILWPLQKLVFYDIKIFIFI